MAKTKRFMDGGYVPPNQYPFANPNSVQVGNRQEPLDEVMGTQEPVTMYKRGGKVKKYAEGGKADYAIPDARARAAMREIENQKATDKAYEEAASRSMGTFKEKTPEAPAKAASAPAKPLKKAGGGCAKGYAEGGVAEGENKNIDDDTRMRARAAIARRMAGEEEETPKPVTKRSMPKVAPKPAADKEEDKSGPSGRARENVAPSGRGAAPGSFRKEPLATAKYPTAEERGAQIRKSLEDAEAENVRKRNERAKSGQSSFSDLMTGFKKRFGTQAMREEAGMKSGGKVKCYSGGGSVRGAGIAKRGVRQCKVV